MQLYVEPVHLGVDVDPESDRLLNDLENKIGHRGTITNRDKYAERLQRDLPGIPLQQSGRAANRLDCEDAGQKGADDPPRPWMPKASSESS